MAKVTARVTSTRTKKNEEDSDFLIRMSHAPQFDVGMHGFVLVPAALFTAVCILLVHQYKYYRDMTGYYWTTAMGGTADDPGLIEFFSHYKVLLITICFVLALIFLLYRVVTQSLYVKRTVLYIPMLVYLIFVLLSFAFSETKEIAWSGWNDRFEGTFVLLCYMVMLFYIVNSVNNERNIKHILYPVTGSAVILSLIGFSQAIGHDFFRTTIGQKVLLPMSATLKDGTKIWDAIDTLAEQGKQYLNFRFKNNEIYQTVFNINYVSFYLTLLIPIFGLLFIREHVLWKKTLWGVVVALIIFNLFGAASSGGILGCVVIVIVALILLNKRLLKWWRSVAVLLAIVALTGVAAYSVEIHFGSVIWIHELRGSVRDALGIKTAATEPVQPVATGTEEPVPEKHKIDYFITNGLGITFSIDGNEATCVTNGEVVGLTDAAGVAIEGALDPVTQRIVFSDERFKDIYFYPAEEDGRSLFVFGIEGEETEWPFVLTGTDQPEWKYENGLKKLVSLKNIPHFGFANNPHFGSGRGYIWSTTIPMLRNTILIGYGADTFCINFPQNDYVGKYNAGWNSLTAIVDKPHNMYLGVAFTTGIVSLLALLALFGIYAFQSIRLYRRDDFNSFAAFAGAGIFLGICGFLVAGLVNDSAVSVMPMFYGLLGTGIAVNLMVQKQKILS
ncbi:MAG: O-antigen ligase family protein [Clostridiales Family XIII bacterium]|nr:O-antigen ligase family protein [Clostridiales Family XIII bacterium]